MLVAADVAARRPRWFWGGGGLLRITRIAFRRHGGGGYFYGSAGRFGGEEAEAVCMIEN